MKKKVAIKNQNKNQTKRIKTTINTEKYTLIAVKSIELEKWHTDMQSIGIMVLLGRSYKCINNLPSRMPIGHEKNE